MALKPSLEGWKPPLQKLSVDRFTPLKPSLEGWKQEHVPGELVAPRPLETFLRGMETLAGEVVGRSHSGGLETFLRGMETFSIRFLFLLIIFP